MSNSAVTRCFGHKLKRSHWNRRKGDVTPMKHGQSTTQVIREKNQPLSTVGTADLLDYVRNADEQHNVIIKVVKRPQKQQNRENISKNKII